MSLPKEPSSTQPFSQPAAFSAATPAPSASWRVVSALAVGYIGVYLCRKNLAVAMPLLQESFSASKEEVGRLASAGTLAYAVGKIVTGPLVDHIGGRASFLLSLVAVALFGATSALAPGLGVLTVLYSLNRFAGAAGWSAMMKLVPTWFGTARIAFVIGLLSLSYVAGGVAATLLARQILQAGGGWRSVMGLPSALLALIALFCIFTVKRGPLHPRSKMASAAEPTGPSGWQAILSLLQHRQFLVVCALSFIITLMRESFNTWSVDFLTSIQGTKHSVVAAALHSIGFDVAGGLSILVTGLIYDRTAPASRRWFIAGTLTLLAAVLAILPRTSSTWPQSGPWLVAAVGLLVYGPYSLLSGVLAVQSGGPRLAATAAGLYDAVGNVAGVLAGTTLGWLLDRGGYALGFGVLAVVTMAAALLALLLRPQADLPA